MNRQLSTAEIDALLQPKSIVMTRKEKLLRLAMLVSQAKARVVIFSNIEYANDSTLAGMSRPDSVFAIAANDPTLAAAGLKGDDVLTAKRFFELSSSDLHIFSCDCGGDISNRDMAHRLQAIAEPARSRNF